MPEGHTLHRLARLHQRKFGRAPVIVSSPQGRFVDGAAAVNGRVLKKASAWGKHLFHHYEGGRVVHVHLGLYGTFSEVEVPMPLPVGQVRMRMVGTEFGTDLRGPTVCEVIDEAEVDDVVARLGPDPLRRDADGVAGVGANQQVPQADRCAADGSDGDRRASATCIATNCCSVIASTRTGRA